MQLVTETNSDKEKILIIDRSSSSILPQLRKLLSKYDTDVYVSPQMTPTIDTFHLCYVLNEPFSSAKRIIHAVTKTKVVFIYQNHKKAAREVEEYIKQHFPGKKSLVKSVEIDSSDRLRDDDMEKILWFTYSDTSDVSLRLHPQHIEAEATPLPQVPKAIPLKYAKRKRTMKQTLFLIFLAIFLVHLAFVPPLLLANVMLYKTKDIAMTNITKGIKSLKSAEQVLSFSEGLYNFVRPTYQLFSLSYLTDGVMQLDDSIVLTAEKSIVLYNDANSFSSLLLKKDKNKADIQLLQSAKQRMSKNLDDFDQYLTIVIQKLPDWKRLDSARETLTSVSSSVKTAQKVFQHLDSIFAKDTQKEYLILFANNMEIRPGGGFIGSFGVVNVHNYTVDPVKLYDVYDADGQLKNHIDPPNPIRLYLQQPHWFLRDSAFSPDFATNYTQAKSFLAQEMGFDHFDGGILLTTTTIQNILEGMGNLYIPDFNEMVNKDNFYIKAQLYSENNFFPGSTQKKRFLGAVADQLLLNLEKGAPPKVLQMVQKSLEEKQMVMYFDDPDLQQTVNDLYWSGQALVPQCPTGVKNCINNYIFPYEANLGVNKANFFEKKLISIQSRIDQDGIVNNKLQLTIQNNSISNVFPGGIYKDYFQVILPSTAKVSRVTKNDTLVDNYDLEATDNILVGVYLEIPAQSTTKLEIDYSIETGLDTGKGAYQFVVQKQIGSPNSELQFALSYPSNIHVLSQNFSPLVKPHEILYNTTLTADKIFLIELLKENGK